MVLMVFHHKTNTVTMLAEIVGTFDWFFNLTQHYPFPPVKQCCFVNESHFWSKKDVTFQNLRPQPQIAKLFIMGEGGILMSVFMFPPETHWFLSGVPSNTDKHCRSSTTPLLGIVYKCTECKSRWNLRYCLVKDS